MPEAPRTRAALESGLAAGREIGVQLFATRRGEPVADLALGSARAGTPMRSDTLCLWLSMSKPVMGIAYGQLLERGLVKLDDRVADHLPAFAAGGKAEITLAHLLTHTAGFRDAWREWLAPSFDEVVARICAAPQEDGWVEGETSGYNVAAAWYVLAAVLEKLDGRDYRSYTREEIFEPLGMLDSWISIPVERFRAYGSRVSAMQFFEDGRFVTSPAWGTEQGVSVPRAGGNGYGPMREHVRIYELLLGRGERAGVRLLESATADVILQRRSEGRMDRSFGGVLDRGLGVVLDSKRHERGLPWFGPHASDASFGHAGFFSSVGFGDPAHDLAVALCWNGVRAFDPVHDQRVDEVLDALYRDLALV